MDGIVIKLVGIGVLAITNAIAQNLHLRKTETITTIGLTGTITYMLVDSTIDLIKVIKETF